jgi:hypothetical protein
MVFFEAAKINRKRFSLKNHQQILRIVKNFCAQRPVFPAAAMVIRIYCIFGLFERTNVDTISFEATCTDTHVFMMTHVIFNDYS